MPEDINISVEEKQEKSRIKIITAYDAMQPQDPINWIVSNLIPEASVSVFYGEPGIGKTWAMLSLAVHVAEGKNWLGFEIKNPENVLIIDEESGEKRLKYRLQLTLKGEKGNAKTPIFANCLSSIQLDVKSDMRILQKTIEEVGAKLLIIDSLSTCMSGDENDKKDVQPVFNHLRKLANLTNCAIVVIHHANKKGGYRGSSAIGGAVDLMVKVESKNNTMIEFATEKTRDILFTSWNAEMIWNAERFFLKNISAFEAREDLKQLNVSQRYVMQFLLTNGDSKLSEIESSADTCSPKAAKLAVYKLVEMNKIRRINPSENRKMEAIYGII